MPYIIAFLQEKVNKISKIMFYKLSQLTKNGKRYVVANADPITLGNMNPKILSNELAQIYLACSK